ncbi:MAG: NTP transferase domain-containing protein [Roseibacillus sp.]|nr:NTP transferase domain-containing protein [Roseibacillus sp.]
MSAPIRKAFLLGAGLGTRLRPLTNILPKPLIPVFHRPLIEYALDHCLAAGIEEFAINTHHLPEKWEDAFPNGSYRGASLTFFHEPVLLETGGGLKNIESWIGDEPLLVYNGDILTTLDLTRLVDTHTRSGKTVTMGLRSTGHEPHIAIDGERIVDIRRMLGIAPGTHQFACVYCAQPGLLQHIPSAEKVSIIPSFLELVRNGEMGASIHDEGIWLDLGTRESYLDAHNHRELGELRHPEAHIDSTAMVEASAIGPGASIGADATVLASVLWPGACIEEGAQLTNCIVYSSTLATGPHHNADL